MDTAKCRAVKQELAAQPEPQLVSAARFFDGNDDLGSIGCNLSDHPGIETFRKLLVGVMDRPDVEAVSDEPEGAAVLTEVRAMKEGLAENVRERVHLACLPMNDISEAASS